jgi:sarcosine oxidase gamma subunit
MTAGELKEILATVPDTWTVVVEQPEGDRYHTEGARQEEKDSELVIEL